LILWKTPPLRACSRHKSGAGREGVLSRSLCALLAGDGIIGLLKLNNLA
jgi:hypothetical protein